MNKKKVLCIDNLVDGEANNYWKNLVVGETYELYKETKHSYVIEFDYVPYFFPKSLFLTPAEHRELQIDSILNE